MVLADVTNNAEAHTALAHHFRTTTGEDRKDQLWVEGVKNNESKRTNGKVCFIFGLQAAGQRRGVGGRVELKAEQRQ